MFNLMKRPTAVQTHVHTSTNCIAAVHSCKLRSPNLYEGLEIKLYEGLGISFEIRVPPEWRWSYILSTIYFFLIIWAVPVFAMHWLVTVDGTTHAWHDAWTQCTSNPERTKIYCKLVTVKLRSHKNIRERARSTQTYMEYCTRYAVYLERQSYSAIYFSDYHTGAQVGIILTNVSSVPRDSSEDFVI